MIDLSRGINDFELVSMSKRSKSRRGLIRFPSLKAVRGIVVNICTFHHFIKQSQVDGSYQRLMEIMCPDKFDLIMMDNAYEIISHKHFIINFLKVWNRWEFVGAAICKSNDIYCYNVEDHQMYQEMVENDWMQYWYPTKPGYGKLLNHIK